MPPSHKADEKIEYSKRFDLECVYSTVMLISYLPILILVISQSSPCINIFISCPKSSAAAKRQLRAGQQKPRLQTQAKPTTDNCYKAQTSQILIEKQSAAAKSTEQ